MDYVWTLSNLSIVSVFFLFDLIILLLVIILLLYACLYIFSISISLYFTFDLQSTVQNYLNKVRTQKKYYDSQYFIVVVEYFLFYTYNIHLYT